MLTVAGAAQVGGRISASCFPFNFPCAPCLKKRFAVVRRKHQSEMTLPWRGDQPVFGRLWVV